MWPKIMVYGQVRGILLRAEAYAESPTVPTRCSVSR
jgi:hypothetical protein